MTKKVQNLDIRLSPTRSRTSIYIFAGELFPLRRSPLQKLLHSEPEWDTTIQTQGGRLLENVKIYIER